MPTNSAHAHVSNVAPSRAGKKGILFHIEPELAEGLKIIAGIHGQSMEKYMKGLVIKDLAAQRIPRQLAEAIRQVTERQPPPIASPRRLESALRLLTAAISPPTR